MKTTPVEALAWLIAIAEDIQNGAQGCSGMSICIMNQVATLAKHMDLDADEINRTTNALHQARQVLYDVKEGSRASTPP